MYLKLNENSKIFSTIFHILIFVIIIFFILKIFKNYIIIFFFPFNYFIKKFAFINNYNYYFKYLLLYLFIEKIKLI